MGVVQTLLGQCELTLGRGQLRQLLPLLLRLQYRQVELTPRLTQSAQTGKADFMNESVSTDR